MSTLKNHHQHDANLDAPRDRSPSAADARGKSTRRRAFGAASLGPWHQDPEPLVVMSLPSVPRPHPLAHARAHRHTRRRAGSGST
eukprot:791172-Prymnesium_polylepis.1